MIENILTQLITMSRNLGDPLLDYAILGEGNTSARADAQTFWVKASGVSLQALDADGLVRVDFKRVMELLNGKELSDTEIRAGLESARVDRQVQSLPSVETFLHALALQLEDVAFVGHTHPAPINALLCSQKSTEAVSGRLFPDHVVYCGPASVYIPYTDPGLPLARAVRAALNEYSQAWGQSPKVIFMQNHGLIALGKNAQDVENITAMAVKAARILLGTYALGGPNFLSSEQVQRIHTRPDEHYRRNLWETQ